MPFADEADPHQRDVDVLGGLVDATDRRIAQEPPPLALDLAQRQQVLHRQRPGVHVRPVLRRHHAHQGVREQVDELERALAGQRVEGQVAKPSLVQLTDRLIQREPAREPHAQAVGGDLLEVGRRGGAQLFLDVAASAGRDDDGVAQTEALDQSGLELLAPRQIELDAHEALVERALEQPRHRRGRDAERAGDVLLALLLAVVELEAVHRLPKLARGEGGRLHAVVIAREINFISVNFLLDGPSVPRYPRCARIHFLTHHARRRACLRGATALRTASPLKFTDYHQSKDELAGLPVTVAEKIPVTNTPNIFSYKSYIFAKNPALVQRYIKATKADVGGVGGHVVAADEVKSIIAKYVLDNNSYRGEPIFTSMIVTHTGDDCAVTGIMAETVDMSVVDELMWDALQEGATKAAELGLYGPGQDLVADAFTGNLRGAGPATVALPFPVRKDNASQTVLVSFADKTEPMAFNHYATGAYMLPRFNTGLVIAASKMKRGYVFEIVDLDTKAQAVEAGAHPRDQRALDGKMEEVAKGLAGEGDHLARARRPLRHRGAHALLALRDRAHLDPRRQNEKDQLGYICSAERLHNIKTKKGFTYGGKDDPGAPGLRPGRLAGAGRDHLAVGDRADGGRRLPRQPQPAHPADADQLADLVLVGPDPVGDHLSCNIHTGRIGAISDQFALGTPWDEVRRTASQARHPVPPRARDQAAGDPARGRARVPGGLEGAAQPPRGPVRGQAAAHLRKRQRPRQRRRQEAGGRAQGRPARRDRLARACFNIGGSDAAPPEPRRDDSRCSI